MVVSEDIESLSDHLHDFYRTSKDGYMSRFISIVMIRVQPWSS